MSKNIKDFITNLIEEKKIPTKNEFKEQLKKAKIDISELDDLYNKASKAIKDKDNIENIEKIFTSHLKEDKNKKLKDIIKKQEEEIANLKLEIFKLNSQFESHNNALKEKALNLQKDAQNKLNEFKENYLKKQEVEISHIKKYRAEKVIDLLADPLIQLELAVNAGKNSNNDSLSAYVQGFEMLLQQIYLALESESITKIAPKAGDEFSPELHNAISTITGDKENIIAEFKRPGFMIHDRVIKPATVVIYKKK